MNTKGTCPRQQRLPKAGRSRNIQHILPPGVCPRFGPGERAAKQAEGRISRRVYGARGRLSGPAGLMPVGILARSPRSNFHARCKNRVPRLNGVFAVAQLVRQTDLAKIGRAHLESVIVGRCFHGRLGTRFAARRRPLAALELIAARAPIPRDRARKPKPPHRRRAVSRRR
jgi:hypothetical protein